jgi:hypothetical protein
MGVSARNGCDEGGIFSMSWAMVPAAGKPPWRGWKDSRVKPSIFAKGIMFTGIGRETGEWRKF